MVRFKEGSIYSYDKKNKNILLEVIFGAAHHQMYDAFETMFSALNLECFLFEYEYVDKDYLEDYSNYYVRCHHQYERFCTRIHFFTKNKKFNLKNKNFAKLLRDFDSLTSSNLNDIYLGFIVLRPFDYKRLGRTCLKHYEEKNDSNRRYSATRNYNVNLYGIPLSVKSMAFQEQDETIAVCASIALWSAFNITGKKYHHPILPPSEITKLALSETSYARNFPNDGLTQEQIAVAISKINLTPLLIEPIDDRQLKSNIYSFIRAGIPIICGISLYDQDSNGNVIFNTESFHAVTINGFSFEDGKEEVTISDGLKLYSSRMTKFFVHDDQICPFARMTFGKKLKKFENNFRYIPIETNWSSNNSENKKVAKVESLIVPLYHKIRIQYEDIASDIQSVNDYYRYVASEAYGLKIDFEWDIFLTEVNDLKKELIFSTNKIINKDIILKDKFAKYLWRARAMDSDKYSLFEIIFDATESKNGDIVQNIICYDQLAHKILIEDN